MSKDQSHSGEDANENAENTDKFSPPEYRLVPIDYWERSGQRREIDKRGIDVRQLGNTVWKRRRFVFRVTAVFVLIGLLIALLSPLEYKSEATLLPENSSGSTSAQGLIDQYGPLLGIGGGSLNLDQEESITPKLYPEIVNSLPYQLELLNKPVRFAKYDTTVTAYTFFSEIQTPSVFGYIKAYTLGLPGKIQGLFTPETPPEPLPRGFAADSIFSLTKRQTIFVQKMRSRISVTFDDENNTILLAIEMPDATATAQLGKISIDLLKEYVTNYRTQKANEDLDFSREQLAKAKEEFENIQARKAEFEDQNLGQLTAKAETQLQRLESEYDLAFNKYNGLAQQVERAKLKVQEKMPVVTVLKPIEMPVDNYKPHRKVIVILSLIIGLMLTVGYIIAKKIVASRNADSLQY